MIDCYQAAHQTAIMADRSRLGLLQLGGATRLDLLHRMSTQAVNGLQAGQGAATILTTDIGRMIDRLILYADEQLVYALTGENNGAGVARYLLRFVFFNDDFQISPLDDQALLGVYGRRAGEMLAEWLGQSVDWPLHHWRNLAWGESWLAIHRTDGLAGDGYLVRCPAGAKSQLWQQLEAHGFVPAGESDLEYLRLEAGLPRFGREITLDYIPLEANLWADVSFKKGCYIGQEIIARMESRGKLAKKLVQFRPERPLPLGLELLADGSPAGTITSVADGPAGPLALAYLKTATLNSQPQPNYTAGDIPLTLL